MVRRLAAILAIALLLAPHPLQERRRPPFSTSQTVSVRAVPVGARKIDEVRVVEAWHIASANSGFGGFSSLAIEGPRQFVIGSDFGSALRLRLGARGEVEGARLWPLPLSARSGQSKYSRDLEALAIDPATGTLWGALEQRHRIVRFAGPLLDVAAQARPPAMLGWNDNGGAEAMVRLDDGRFILLAESSGGPGGGSDALLFARDPTGRPRQQPIRFALDPGGRGRVTDAALLPDGRVLLLFRDIGLVGWISTLAVADPRTIRAGRAWNARTLARFTAPGLSENFEGLAVEPGARPGAPVMLWMVSDDNRAGWQRTLLVKLSWRPAPDERSPSLRGAQRRSNPE